MPRLVISALRRMARSNPTLPLLKFWTDTRARPPAGFLPLIDQLAKNNDAHSRSSLLFPRVPILNAPASYFGPLGFTELWNAGGMAGFERDGCKFLLQHFDDRACRKLYGECAAG